MTEANKTERSLGSRFARACPAGDRSLNRAPPTARAQQPEMREPTGPGAGVAGPVNAALRSAPRAPESAGPPRAILGLPAARAPPAGPASPARSPVRRTNTPGPEDSRPPPPARLSRKTDACPGRPEKMASRPPRRTALQRLPASRAPSSTRSTRSCAAFAGARRTRPPRGRGRPLLVCFRPRGSIFICRTLQMNSYGEAEYLKRIQSVTS